ncbi:hypothetical protein PsorP6_016816 [Peronosclerospora sorghi]|uniref:Uncharacterized protein n=1 Tax=Peronosclerospora sorghi TaxID=230839 RepID=A0ACC0WE00_9STRA|nr:hypothetical protein PsorP6_016816 [Peronosclerospora sorghi]
MELKRDDVKDALDEMVAEAVQFYTLYQSRIVQKPWSIQVKVKESVEVEHLTLVDWRHSTVARLTDYKHFQPALLPKLQLSRSNDGRVYESSSDYFATIVKLCIGMTFVEGNNALLPHFTVKVGDKMCDQPLWPFPGKHEYQRRLRGPPSKYASTHIYDGVISQVKYDRTISLEHVESRRASLASIHWRTTKRLSSPNLVEVVRLSNHEASLRSLDEIYWGEIVFQGKIMDEYKARKQGRLTLQLLQYLDEPGNAMLAHNPTARDAVTIIDCQTFVPEIIPVLKALEKKRQVPMPFHDGALLNLSEHASLCVDQDHVSVDAEEDNDEFESVGLMSISHNFFSTLDSKSGSIVGS